MRLLSFFSLLTIALANDYLPQQIHLSYTNQPTEMMVTWTTMKNATTATVQYSTNTFHHSTTSRNITEFIDGGPLHRTIYINRVLLSNLLQGQKYTYICGTKTYGWSSIYFFVAMKEFPKNDPVTILFYGDFGDANSVSLPTIQQTIDTTNIDAVLHLGDFAYDFYNDNGILGDKFMRDIESIAAYVPYMTAVGNHEYHYNYSHYRNRFTMPNAPTQNMLYSWNIGPLHIISFSTEVYFVPYTRIISKNINAIRDQYEWLIYDLTHANLHRDEQPWIITMAHRPMYCSTPNGDACTWSKNPVRDGILIDNVMKYGLEQLFYDYSVDVELWGHEHNYERLYPVYRGVPDFENIYVHNKTTTYYNPVTPIQIISGGFGNREMHGTPIVFTNNSWSAFTNDDYGYGSMKVYNSTHLHIQQINGTTGGMIDDLWIVKNPPSL